MRHYVVVSFVIAVMAALLGFGDVRNVSGVGRMMSGLHLASNAKPPDAQAQDDEVERALKRVFEAHPDLKHIGIEVTNCVARLEGTVASDGQRRQAVQVAVEHLEALQVARATQAVCFVEDDLRLAH